MSLTRADLEADRLRKFFSEANPGVRVLTEAEQDASLKGLLDQHRSGADVWLFGYGSLVWNRSSTTRSGASRACTAFTAAFAFGRT